ncbi:adenylate/guanylate cyclase domain-containing protein [Pelagibius sp.]|uniref:tetratricopeptide repeat protein n=1 Tax=Pelagibius sp. TaxID=1931238 RepID=UPI00261C13BE|nr:adenylate/guanylate cyclase domain-containing protein [Pelagibius sp.]
MERRLAAILAADVVGYSRLMGQDETGTLRRLTDLRQQVLEPLIAEHHGRLVKLMGDGLLIEFASVVDAIACAVAWQERVTTHEAGCDDGGRLSFRIGINLGDVIIEGEDIYGEGVNVAARLEPLAEPGGICVSSAVYDQVRNKVDHAFLDIGPQALKNIRQPVHAYALQPGRIVVEAPPSPAESEVMADGTGERPSVAVLPFKNLSGDADQEYFADGVSEDIITALSRNRWLMVIARNSSFTYKGESVDLKQVGRQLGARYVLDGSLRKGGDRIRIAAQLIDASLGNQMWAERYDRVLEDIFAVQDEVTEAIVAAIAPELGKAEQQRAAAKTAENLNAWDVYQRGMWHLYRRTKHDLAEACRLFEAALSLDPGLSPACSGLVDAYYYEVVLSLAESPEENRRRALQVARRAVQIDPDDAAAHCAMGKAKIVNQEHALAIPDLQLAIELNPSLAWAHYGIGAATVFAGQAERAITHLEDAIRLSPRDQHMGSFMVRLAEAYLLLQDYPRAVEWARKALQQQGFQWSRYAALLAALGYLGEREQAAPVLSECSAERADFSVSMVRDNHLYTDGKALDHYLEGLRRAGVPE